MKTYKDFCDAVKKRESNNIYNVINSLGYLGAYQFGMARLCDFGLTERITKNDTSYANKAFKFVSVLNKEKFLESPILQDFIFYLHVQNHKHRVEKYFNSYLNKNIQGCLITLSGCIGVLHLLGHGGLNNFLKHNTNNKDAYDTQASDYMKLFAGYDIP